MSAIVRSALPLYPLNLGFAVQASNSHFDSLESQIGENRILPCPLLMHSPDCEAKRLVDKRRKGSQRVRIEFEFLGRNFLENGHPDCPVGILELQRIVIDQNSGMLHRGMVGVHAIALSRL
jgi:hypothetical protein